MDWRVSRPEDTLWQHVRQLLREPGCTLFHDIIIYCSDGVLPWNRLCLALSFPACKAVLAKELNSEAELAVSLPDLAVWQAKEVLEGSIPMLSGEGLHPLLKPSAVSYNLVPHVDVDDEEEDEDEEDERPPSPMVEDEDDFFAAEMHGGHDSESDVETKPDIRKNHERKLDKPKRTHHAEPKKSRSSKGVLISNDLADYTLAECQVCGVEKPLHGLRAHTQSQHNMSITEYKQSFGTDLKLVEKVLHKCGICGDKILHDSDSIAGHLKRPGHNISHKNYNKLHMVDSRGAGRKESMQKEVKYEDDQVKLEPGLEPQPELGKRRRIKKRFHDDYAIAMALDMAEENSDSDYDLEKGLSMGDIAPKKKVDLEDIKNMEQLWKDCKVGVLNYKLSEEEMDEGGVVDLTTKEGFKEKKEKKEKREKLDLPLLPQFKVDSSHGREEEEEVERHLTRFLIGDNVIKKCNICHYQTDRSDSTTMKEHMFSHFPDICGNACPVCRKPEKRKQNLMRHIESAHKPEVLVLFGIESMKQYEATFSSDSDEQGNLRMETYCKLDCSNCKQTYYSAEKSNLHLEMDLCQFVEAPPPKPKKVWEPKIDPETGLPVPLPAKRKRKDILAEEDSDFDPDEDRPKRKLDGSSDDEDFDPNEEGVKRKRGGPGGRSNCVPGSNSATEQLSIDASIIEGFIECITSGGPYMCVIPTCEGKSYPTPSSLRRHYESHDQDMHAMLICPICKFIQADDHPGNMKKHIMNKHEKTEDWAEENVICDVSEKCQQFRDQTSYGKSKRGRPKGRINGIRGPEHVKKTYERNNHYKKLGLRMRFEKCEVSIDDPMVRDSFENGGVGGQWRCGVANCEKTFRIVYELKRHYGKHDRRLGKDVLECNFCSYMAYTTSKMNFHQKQEHPDLQFLALEGEVQYKEVQGENWEAFSEAANDLVKNNRNREINRAEKREKGIQAINQTNVQQCSFCPETFSTQESYDDHDKIHRPHLICHTCPHCQEGFAVESVYETHIRSHSVLYDTLAEGVIRCNGCSQIFHKLKEAKSHMSVNHLNLLENCDFCEHCSEFFTTKLGLRHHMFKHLDASEVFRCPVCQNKKFLSQEELDRHVARKKCKTQDGEQHMCGQCGKVMSKKSNLNLHIKSVHAEKIYRYQCKVCQSLYLTRTLMTMHVRKTHKVPKDGPVNDYIHFYSKEEALLLDVERLNAKKPKGRGGKGMGMGPKFPCPFNCGGTFSKNSLKRHKGKCQQKLEPQEVEEDYTGDDSPYNSQDYRYSFPVHV